MSGRQVGVVCDYREDLSMSMQLGWFSPAPRYLLRMALTTLRARRAAAH